MKFTDQEMQTIDRNLKIDKCPNCGNEDKKYIFPEPANLVQDSDPKDKYDAIVAQCPQCGFLMFFRKEFIMNK